MYGKLFKNTFTGSLYGAGSKVLIVWCWIIANKDKTGRIEINPEELAHRIGDMTPEEVSEAVNFLCAPDTKSRSKAYDGRRLIKEGQYLYWAVNSDQYNAIRNEDERKAYERERKAKQRASKPLEDKDSCPDVCPGQSGTVRDSPGVSAHVDVDINNKLSGKPDAPPANTILYESIVAYLNKQASTHYKPTTPKTRDLIKARWNEGFREEDFKRVIDNMIADWGGDSEWEKYLRPETLFGTKFESYLNRKPKKSREGSIYELAN